MKNSYKKINLNEKPDVSLRLTLALHVLKIFKNQNQIKNTHFKRRTEKNLRNFMYIADAEVDVANYEYDFRENI